MVVDGLQATLGAVYLFGLRAALASSLLWAARRSFAWPAAAAIALVVAAIVPRTVGSVPLALTILWCLVALQREAPAWTARLLVYGGGALAAVEAMVKLNVGVTVLAMVVIAALALEGPRLRNLGRIAASFAIGFAVLWFAAGQGIGNLDDYVSTSVEVISGYQRGMQIENGAVDWDWAAALLVIGATLVAVLATSARERLAARIAIPVLVAVLSFSLLKYGFVRHDAGHVAAVFGVLAVVWLAPLWRGAGRAVAVGAIALIAIVYFPAADESLDTTFEPRLAVEQLGDLVVPGERHEAADSARAAMAAAYAVDPRILERIGDQPVDARPWEVGLAWAYGLNWDPLPVIQDYAAYTPELDQLNADALADPAGPRFVLRHLGYDNSSLVGIDGRLTTFDSPREARTLLCRFRPVLTTSTYQLLERGEVDRCGPERPLQERRGRLRRGADGPARAPGRGGVRADRGRRGRGDRAPADVRLPRGAALDRARTDRDPLSDRDGARRDPADRAGPTSTCRARSRSRSTSRRSRSIRRAASRPRTGRCGSSSLPSRSSPGARAGEPLAPRQPVGDRRVRADRRLVQLALRPDHAGPRPRRLLDPGAEPLGRGRRRPRDRLHLHLRPAGLPRAADGRRRPPGDARRDLSAGDPGGVRGEPVVGCAAQLRLANRCGSRPGGGDDRAVGDRPAGARSSLVSGGARRRSPGLDTAAAADRRPAARGARAAGQDQRRPHRRGDRRDRGRGAARAAPAPGRDRASACSSAGSPSSGWWRGRG